MWATTSTITVTTMSMGPARRGSRCRSTTRKFSSTPASSSVETLKRLAGIPLTDDLDQLIGSKIVPLPDDGRIHITGCEIFLHHPKDGGSS